MSTSELFIVRITRDATRFVARARRVDEEVCGEFIQPQQLLNFLLGGARRAGGDEPVPTQSPGHDSEIAPLRGIEQPRR
jgi:hypothetical protein